MDWYRVRLAQEPSWNQGVESSLPGRFGQALKRALGTHRHECFAIDGIGGVHVHSALGCMCIQRWRYKTALRLG